jgi:hypothetical protein
MGASVLVAFLVAGYLVRAGTALGAAAEAISQPDGKTRADSAGALQGLSAEEWRSIDDLIREASYLFTRNYDPSSPARRWPITGARCAS